MKIFFITVLIGVIAGILDILPMIKMKMDKYSITSAFVFYLVAAFIIANTNLVGVVWWLKGSIITLAMATPVIIIVAKEDKKSIVPISAMAVVLGTLIGVSEQLLLK